MNMASRLVLLCVLDLCLALVSMACDKERDGDRGGPFSGLVVDSVTKGPIDSAMVSINDTSGTLVYTDSTGFFAGATWGDLVTIYVRKEGYETEWKVRDLTKDATDLLFQLQREKSRQSRLNGIVKMGPG